MMITKTRAIGAAVAAALALTSFTATPASARHYGNAAAIAAFATIVGTVATLAARDRYANDPYYAAPAYPYGGPVYVAPRWGHRHQHRWHR